MSLAELFPTDPAHNPGGKPLPLPPGVTATAIYGGLNDCYRYRLDWLWDASKPVLMAGMMNPSCAGHLFGDGTLMWIYRWAVRNGFGRALVGNSAAYRARDQARLAEAADPVGPDNYRHLLEMASRADLIVIGHGKPKVKAARAFGPRMVRVLRGASHELYVWGLSKDGTPKHPLYLPGDTSAERFRP
jgi:hypothetical protein